MTQNNSSEKKIKRILEFWAFQGLTDLDHPMAWITGPRQCGKTFLTKQKFSRHFNWDTPEVKKQYLKNLKLLNLYKGFFKQNSLPACDGRCVQDLSTFSP